MRLRSVITFIAQALLTFVVMLGIYMLFALEDILEFDAVGVIGFVVFPPLLGSTLTLATIVTCFVTGLPIRVNKRFREFWKSNIWISLSGISIGSLLLVEGHTEVLFHDN